MFELRVSSHNMLEVRQKWLVPEWRLAYRIAVVDSP